MLSTFDLLALSQRRHSRSYKQEPWEVVDTRDCVFIASTTRRKSDSSTVKCFDTNVEKLRCSLLTNIWANSSVIIVSLENS